MRKFSQQCTTNQLVRSTRPFFRRKRQNISHRLKKDNANKERFIGEVKNYKEIWNIADESYYDWTKNKISFSLLVLIFYV